MKCCNWPPTTLFMSDLFALVVTGYNTFDNIIKRKV